MSPSIFASALSALILLGAGSAFAKNGANKSPCWPSKMPDKTFVAKMKSVKLYESGIPGLLGAPIVGDQTQPGLFSGVVKVLKGTVVKPHYHSVPELIAGVEGTLHYYPGTKIEPGNRPHVIRPGDFAYIKPKDPHYIIAKEDVLIQIHGVGPYDMIFVNPADDVRPTGKAILQAKRSGKSAKN